jgi:hypothetical protein
MADDEAQALRDTALAIVQRAENDEDFQRQLRDDPEAALTAAGLPQSAIADFAREAEIGDVAGYVGCDNNTCVLTRCARTLGLAVT